jgi:uncharacterized protein YecE (DUF72 family)
MEFDFEAAARLPPSIRFGTSSWKYEGWRGSVYRRDYSGKKQFESQSLQEYAEFPWFRCVGLDSSFYKPPSTDSMEIMSSQVGPEFRWLAKVWDRITIPFYGRHKRYGDMAGKPNPNFLDPSLFREQFLPAFESPSSVQHTGPFIFQFQTTPRMGGAEVAWFLDRLESFLGSLAGQVRCGIEVRNPGLLSARYFGILNDHDATHCFNHWGGMPPLIDQMRLSAAAGGLSATWYLCRLLTPLGMSYKQSVNRFSPYDRLQEVQPQMRRDVRRLAMRALDRGGEAWILVNNRVEGNSPQTIDALGRSIVDAL